MGLTPTSLLLENTNEVMSKAGTMRLIGNPLTALLMSFHKIIVALVEQSLVMTKLLTTVSITVAITKMPLHVSPLLSLTHSIMPLL